MSAIQLVAALLLLVIGGMLVLQWLRGRHGEAWENEGTRKGKTKSRGRPSSWQQRKRLENNNNNEGASEDLSGGEEEDADEIGGGGAAGNPNRVAGHLNRNLGGVRRRGARAHGRQGEQQRRNHHNNNGAYEEDNDNFENDAGNDNDGEFDENGVRLTRLQRKKLAKEREREERRQAQEAALDAQRQRVDASNQREAAAALREEALKTAEEAALRELRAEKEKADNEEYARWVAHIGVEERGELGDEARARQARVHAFLCERAASVRARAQRGAVAPAPAPEEAETEGHVLVLQTAARDLKVSVEELVNTIEQMKRDGEIDGVFDDRGKYVFIAPEHFPQLAQFIRLRGRVSVQEFTRECNRVIMQS